MIIGFGASVAFSELRIRVESLLKGLNAVSRAAIAVEQAPYLAFTPAIEASALVLRAVSAVKVIEVFDGL